MGTAADRKARNEAQGLAQDEESLRPTETKGPCQIPPPEMYWCHSTQGGQHAQGGAGPTAEARLLLTKY